MKSSENHEQSEPQQSGNASGGLCEETVLRIRGDGRHTPANGGRFFQFIAHQLQKEGAAVQFEATDSETTIRVQGMTGSQIDELTCSYLEIVPRLTNHIEIVQFQRLACPLPTVCDVNLATQTLVRERLTKRLLLSLPEGARVVSNCFNGFAEVLGPKETREATWGRAVSTQANGRLCWVYPPKNA